MAGSNGISSYQQINRTIYPRNMGADRMGAPSPSKTDQAVPAKDSHSSRVDTKSWSPIDANSSLVPRNTEYGYTVGDVKLSDKAADYLGKLRSKFSNMEFITVSKDMKAQVQQNAASYGNANRMVVLIDEEKLERMASDESFRKKYEGIIAMSQSKMDAARNSLASTGAAIKNFGMSVDSNGKETFFATLEKSQDLQKKRMEKKAAEKKEHKAREHRKAEKEARQARIEKAREKTPGEADQDEIPPEIEKRIHDKVVEVYGKQYITVEADSADELVSKVQRYSYDTAAARVLSSSERTTGAHVDYRG